MALKMTVERNDTRAFNVPVSDAENVYDLLADVCRAIREEPLRYDQGEWLLKLVEGDYVPRTPACGTVGCRAGWIVQLGAADKSTTSVSSRAKRIVTGPRPDEDAYEKCEEYESVLDDLERLLSGTAMHNVMEAVGTPEYAELGARGVEEFMAKWEERLKATPVVRSGA